MKKLESIEKSKFGLFKNNKIKALSRILGGAVQSPADACGYCDSYDWTARQLKDAQGKVIGTVNDQDNLKWYICTTPAISDTLCRR